MSQPQVQARVRHGAAEVDDFSAFSTLCVSIKTQQFGTMRMKARENRVNAVVKWTINRDRMKLA